MSSEFNETPVAKPLEFLADRYDRIVSIGSGAMGDVYKARDKKLKLDVAVKVLSKQTPTDKDLVRFHREAKAYGKCNHENLVKILDFGLTEASEPYLIMEFFDGANVDDIILARQAPPTRKELATWLEIFVQVCRGMEHAHKNGIVHRDVKTRNILVARMDDPSKPAVKIIDFGLAKIEDYAGDATLTKVGAVVGSPLYLSPEQAGGNKADARSDIYSFGCVMYFALTGQLPFRGETPLATIRGHLKEPPRPLSEINAEVDEVLEAIVLRCLEKAPEDRYQTMSELESALLKRLEKGAPDIVPAQIGRSAVSDSAASDGSLPRQTAAQRKISMQKLTMALLVVFCMFAAVFWLDQAIKGQLQERETTAGSTTGDVSGGKQATEVSESASTSSTLTSDFPPGIDPAERSTIWTDADKLFQIKAYGDRLYVKPKEVKIVTDSDLSKINWEKLDKHKRVEIDLCDCPKVKGSGLQFLPFQRIYSLRATRSGIEDSAFHYIAKMTNLENLTLTYTSVSVDGLQKIIGLKNLKSLHLGYCAHIDNRAAMLVVKTWPDLNFLSLADARMTRAPIKELSKFKHLVELSLSDTPANDEDVIALSNLKLSELHLNHCPITDRALKAIEGMPNLRMVGIIGCRGLTEEGREELRNKRQNLKFPGEPDKAYVDFYFSDEPH